MKYLLPLAFIISFTAYAGCDLEKPVRLDKAKLRSEGKLVFDNVQTEIGPGKLTLVLVENTVAARFETNDGKVWGPRLDGKYEPTVEEGLYLEKELYPFEDGTVVHTVKNVFDFMRSDLTVAVIDYYKTFVWIKGDLLTEVTFEDREDIVYSNGTKTWVVDPFCVEKI